MNRATRIWFWLYALAIAGLLLCAAARAAEPRIAVSVVGDDVVLIVRSTVRFTVWSSTNPTAIWWPMYSSPEPARGQALVWINIGSKAGLYPAWCFWSVTEIRTTQQK